jgi:hypothetical protein
LNSLPCADPDSLGAAPPVVCRSLNPVQADNRLVQAPAALELFGREMTVRTLFVRKH